MNHPNIPKHNPNANVHSVDELMKMNQSVEVMIVDSSACYEKYYTVLDLSSFSNLKVFEVGDYSFTYVEEVKMIGLNRLEKVGIGENCFTKRKDWSNHDRYGMDPIRHFVLKDCERLRELRIARYSFMDYSACEIENDENLEVIEMGELKEYNRVFCYASLTLKSNCDGVKR